MISPKALRDAVAKKLAKISEAKIYENTVIKNFSAPCFFVEIPKYSCVLFKDGAAEVTTEIQITYFPPIATGERVRSDKATLCMMGKIAKEFCEIEAEDRVFTAEEVNFSFLGENTDVLQTNIELGFLDDLGEEEEAELIENVEIEN